MKYFLLLESGDYLLQEDDISKIILYTGEDLSPICRSSLETEIEADSVLVTNLETEVETADENTSALAVQKVTEIEITEEPITDFLLRLCRG